jgi:hypothetical protein
MKRGGVKTEKSVDRENANKRYCVLNSPCNVLFAKKYSQPSEGFFFKQLKYKIFLLSSFPHFQSQNSSANIFFFILTY